MCSSSAQITCALQHLADATMLCTPSHLDAAIAGHAMAVDALPPTRQALGWTVVDALRLAVVPELADVAEILPRMRLPDWSKALSSRLWLPLAAVPSEPWCLGDGTGKRRREVTRNDEDDDDTIDADEYEDEDEEDSFHCAASSQ